MGDYVEGRIGWPVGKQYFAHARPSDAIVTQRQFVSDTSSDWDARRAGIRSTVSDAIGKVADQMWPNDSMRKRFLQIGEP